MTYLKNKLVQYQNLGLIDFKMAWDLQEKLLAEIVEVKILNKNKETQEIEPTKNHLIFCEHPHVYTMGKSGKEKNLLLNQEELSKRKIDYYKINRGGDITYHGPGQLVGYPIIDLENFFTDIHNYLRLLEEAVILTLNEYNVTAGRIDGLTGVWVDHENPLLARKICAMGVKCSRWVTMHGFAFNVNTDLSYFDNIIPCGIDDKSVTSLNNEIGSMVDFNEVQNKVKRNLALVFCWDN
jgi:lipoyl(octanoyl) transferase